MAAEQQSQPEGCQHPERSRSIHERPHSTLQASQLVRTHHRLEIGVEYNNAIAGEEIGDWTSLRNPEGKNRDERPKETG